MSWKKWCTGAVLAMTVSACGSAGASNVAACKSFLNKVKCGSVDISTSFNCDTYANTTCDISEYFTCVESAYVCTNGMYDTSKLASASTCVTKSTCK